MVSRRQEIFFAAETDSPPVPEGHGGEATEIRLFAINPDGSAPEVISGRGGSVSNIDSCEDADRILYERFLDISKIYMVDSRGSGSAFAHGG